MGTIYNILEIFVSLVIPGRSLNQPQHELIGSPRRREAREEGEKKEEEEESHGNQKNADKEPTQVKRLKKIRIKLRSSKSPLPNHEWDWIMNTVICI